MLWVQTEQQQCIYSLLKKDDLDHILNHILYNHTTLSYFNAFCMTCNLKRNIYYFLFVHCVFIEV